jgi:hypothetical protein
VLWPPPFPLIVPIHTHGRETLITKKTKTTSKHLQDLLLGLLLVLTSSSTVLAVNTKIAADSYTSSSSSSTNYGSSDDLKVSSGKTSYIKSDRSRTG